MVQGGRGSGAGVTKVAMIRDTGKRRLRWTVGIPPSLSIMKRTIRSRARIVGDEQNASRKAALSSEESCAKSVVGCRQDFRRRLRGSGRWQMGCHVR